jgi:predicted nucleic acid-binding protein
VTVIDTSGVVDYLLGFAAVHEVERLIESEGELAAPEILVFEVVAVLRRLYLRGELTEDRAAGAIADLGDLPLTLFGSMPLRQQAWAMRANLTAADALFVALAQQLSETLATKDRALAAAIAGEELLDEPVIRL